MQSRKPVLTPELDTVAELRTLYRAAEARAARLRLLSGNGRQLAVAEAATLPAILQGCADRLGFSWASAAGPWSQQRAADCR